MTTLKLSGIALALGLTACSHLAPVAENAVKPIVVTDPVAHDTDDPAIWINRADTMQSLVFGTDKDSDGALYAFDLDGKIVRKSEPLKRPNNVDIAYDLLLAGTPTDIAVVTERETRKVRIFRLPGLQPIDNGGIPVFAGEAQADPMGVAIYTRPTDSAIFVIVGRKEGPAEGYLWQYRLQDDGKGQVKANLVRKFGKYSGKKEIEAIAVDNTLGHVYYSDETVGVRKYFADPDRKDDRELGFFGQQGFASDHEGISLYPERDSTGCLLVSNQQANSFMIFRREGKNDFVGEVPVSTIESDGSEITPVTFGGKFPGGLFVAMSNGRVFHYYAWDDLKDRLK
ncbi:phytase [Chitinophaga caseinilytica]|uniref:phytase n=1 Tax=Chitinophaga caseinilytica TaxID=2267521 RepID=UPI003C2BDE53